jgi:hypothetical protein
VTPIAAITQALLTDIPSAIAPQSRSIVSSLNFVGRPIFRASLESGPSLMLLPGPLARAPFSVAPEKRYNNVTKKLL